MGQHASKPGGRVSRLGQRANEIGGRVSRLGQRTNKTDQPASLPYLQHPSANHSMASSVGITENSSSASVSTLESTDVDSVNDDDPTHDPVFDTERSGKVWVKAEIKDKDSVDLHFTLHSNTRTWFGQIEGYFSASGNQQASVYQRRLSDDEKRLIVLLPSDDHNERVDCWLSCFPRHDCPSYTALSYCWGDATVTKEIWCNNRAVGITVSLEGALKRLRRSEQVRLVWADALCINQGDTIERNTQVPLMSKIYRDAFLTVAWLGEAHDSDAQTLAKIFGLAREGRGNLKWELADKETRNIVESFCENSYFRRIWCVQEVRLSSRVLLCYGVCTITAGDLILFTSQARFLPVKLPLLNINAMFRWNRILKEIYLIDLLIEYPLYSDATEPKDKIYGIVSLATPESREGLHIDYAKPVGTVYADACLACWRFAEMRPNTHSRYSQYIKAFKTLSLIRHPRDYNGGDGFKSWVPRFDIGIGRAHWRSLHDIYPMYGSLKNKREVVISGGDLCIKGVLLEQIQSVEPIMLAHELMSLQTGPATTAINEVIQQGFALDTMARTPTVDRNTLPNFPVGYFHTRNIRRAEDKATSDKNGRCLHEDLARYVLARNIRLAEDEMGGELNDRCVLTGGRFPEGLGRIIAACADRRLFWTTDGTYGLGPACLRPRDIVVSLYIEAHHPAYMCALRPIATTYEGYYLFLGEVYIDRYFTLEWDRKLSSGDLKEKMFRLV